jgi:hypothetical protein
MNLDRVPDKTHKETADVPTFFNRTMIRTPNSLKEANAKRDIKQAKHILFTNKT